MPTKKQETAIEPVAPMAIQTAATRELTPAIWRMIETMAPVMYKAHLFGVQSPDQAAAIMLKGYELGLSITASFELVQVIQGKPALSPRGAMALLLSNPLVKDVQIKRLETQGKFTGYECTMTRNTGFTYTSKFTMEMAQKAGLVKPDSGWMKYEENMCLWRAIGFAADVVFPDVTAGMITLMKAPEMYGVVLTENGDVIDAPPVTVPNVDPLQDLINEFGAEAIMQANNGQIPTGGQQIAVVERTLRAQKAMVGATNRD